MIGKPFPKPLLNGILRQVDELIKTLPAPHYAAFDADGTLWDNDVGENFFQYQIDHCDIPLLKTLDPWDHYEALKKKHPPDAYLWLAQLCDGRPIEEVREWSRRAAEKEAPRVFDSQRDLIRELVDRGVKIFVVSASVHWAVEGALPAIGLKAENALGVKTKIVDGKVSLEGDGPVTWREGKRLALLEKTAGVRPLLSSGNTSGDIHLLECSQGVALAVQSQLPDSFHAKLFDDEQTLLKLAKQNNWLTHSFT
jgi:phosphoserine phosphatase